MSQSSFEMKRKFPRMFERLRRFVFYPSGDIYISYISSFLKKKSFLDKDTFPFIIEKHKSIDIDDIYDFKLGEIKLKISRHN